MCIGVNDAKAPANQVCITRIGVGIEYKEIDKPTILNSLGVKLEEGDIVTISNTQIDPLTHLVKGEDIVLIWPKTQF